MDFDDTLPALGGFGRYQKLLYLALLIPANFPLSFVMLAFAFVSAVPNHWCSAPELQDHRIPSNIAKNLSIPWELRDGKQQLSRCKMYDVNYTEVAMDYLFNNVSSPNSTWSITNCKYGWDYDRSTYYNTLVTEMNIVCDKEWMTTLGNSMLYVGSVFSQLLIGYMADRWGRKPAFFIILLSTIVVGIASCFPPNYTAYIVYRGILGFTASSLYLTPFVLMTELTIPEKRCSTGMICGLVYAVALVIYTGFAYLLRSWFYISLMYCVPFIPILAYWWFVPESPRWLISQNRIDEAEKIVQKIAKVNKRSIEKDFLKKSLVLKQKEESTSTASPYLELLKYPNMRMRQLILCYIWGIITLVYIVLVFNASNMQIDEYLANAIVSFSEIPGILITMVAMDKIGRMLSLSLSMGIAGLGCLSITFLPSDYVWTPVILATIGKAGVTGAYCLVFVYGCELFPTSLRSSALSLPYLTGGLCTIFAPYVLTLSTYGKTIPLLFNGILCISASLAALALPETLDIHLPQTAEDGENLGLNNCFNIFCWKRRKCTYNLDGTRK